MIRRLLLLALLCCHLGPLALAQAPASQSDIDALKARVEQLEAENAALRGQIATAKSTEQAQRTAAEAQRAAAEANLKQAELAQAAAQVSQFTDRVDALLYEREVMQKSRLDQMRKLEQELARFRELEAEIQSQGDSLSAAPEAVQVMAARMAEAQVENRLAKLEAEALLEALQEHVVRAIQANLAVEKADKLVKQRRDELQQLLADSNRGGLDAAQNAVLDAENLLLSARKNYYQSIPEYNLESRIAETAIDLAVSRNMEAGIAKEMSRIKELLNTGNQFGQVKAQIDMLQKQLMEIKLAASEQEREFQMRQQSEAARMEREVLFPMQVRERMLTDSVGEGHPSTIAIRKEIELVQRQIAAVRATKRALDRETERVRDGQAAPQELKNDLTPK